MTNASKSSRKWREKNLAKGNCWYCASPPKPGRRLCPRHLAYQRQYKRESYDDKFEGSNRCSQCGRLGHNAQRCDRLRQLRRNGR